jgi:Disulfide bond chaperones of the HSP33 family
MDILKRFMIADKTVLVSVISAKDLVNEAVKFHRTSRTATAALGRSLMACAFMAQELKSEKHRLSVTINGGGALGRIVVCGEYGCHVRGYVENPSLELPLNARGKLDVGGAVGNNGYISVIKDLGLKEPYSGRSALVNGEIAEDFAYYFTVSEQQPSAVALGVLAADGCCISAGGVLVQVLPGCNENVITMLEDIVSNFTDISVQLKDGTPDDIIEKYFSHLDVFMLDDVYPVYECNCSEERIQKVVLALGRDEAYDVIRTEGKLELSCQFCDKKYVFDKHALDKLFLNA